MENIKETTNNKNLRLNLEDLKKYSKIVKESFDNKPIYKTENGYEYDFLPITDGPITTKTLNAIGTLIAWHITHKQKETESLFTEADRGGGQVATVIANKINKPISWSNHFNTAFAKTVPEITSITPRPEYHPEAAIGILNKQKYKKVIAVDDILSTGTTFNAIISLLEKKGVQTQAFYAVGEKEQYKGRKNIQEKHKDLKVITLAKIQHEYYENIEELIQQQKPIGKTKVVWDDKIFYE